MTITHFAILTNRSSWLLKWFSHRIIQILKLGFPCNLEIHNPESQIIWGNSIQLTKIIASYKILHCKWSLLFLFINFFKILINWTIYLYFNNGCSVVWIFFTLRSYYGCIRNIQNFLLFNYWLIYFL